MNPVQQRLLLYLMQRELEEEQLLRDIDFKNLVFASDPALFFQLFPEEFNQGDDPDLGFEVEEVEPENEDDVMKMMREFNQWSRDQPSGKS